MSLTLTVFFGPTTTALTTGVRDLAGISHKLRNEKSEMPESTKVFQKFGRRWADAQQGRIFEKPK